MTADPGMSAETGAPTSAAPGRAASGITLWDLVKGLAKVAIVLVVLAGLLFAWFVWQLQQSYPAPHAVGAGVAWTSRDAVLSAARPVARGRLTIEGSTIPTSGRLGVNAGVPSVTGPATGSGTATPPAPSGTPGISIEGPRVQLTWRASEGLQTCIAPCELKVPPDFTCGSGACRMVIEVTVELVGDASTIGGTVEVAVSGGLSAGSESQMPASLSVDFLLDGASGPGTR